MANNELEVSKSFADKMKERVKDSIGDLLPDEDLAKIVEEGIKMAFFQPYNVTEGYSRVTKPPLAKEMAIDLIRERVAENIDKWFIEHDDDIKCILDDIIREGIARIVFQSFENKTQSALMMFQSTMINQLNNLTKR